MSLDQVGTYLGSIDYAGWGNVLVGFAKDWQTMIAGILALAGAWATVSSVNRQIRHSIDTEQRRRADEARAARAVIPMALSELSSYAEKCIIVLAMADFLDGSEAIERQLVRLPTLPTDLTNHFKDAIRFSDAAEQASMADLLAWLQVHEARLSHLRASDAGSEGPPLGLPQAIMDAAELHSRATKLFGWARGDLGRITYREALASLRTCLIDYEEHPRLMQLLKVRQRASAAD